MGAFPIERWTVKVLLELGLKLPRHCPFRSPKDQTSKRRAERRSLSLMQAPQDLKQVQ